MLLRTHLAIGAFAIILFLPIVNNAPFFILMALFATVLPDMDSPFTKMGHSKLAKAAQVFTTHRGFIHSLTFCLLISLILALFLPVLVFGFFLGFSIHLLSDSFTKMGITPFWPYSKKVQGLIRTAGVVERGVFCVFVFMDLLLAMVYLF